MTHGRPDWNTAINIVGQDIDQVIERPKYGKAAYASYADIIPEDDADAIFSITGTGMIYGGSIYHLGAFDTRYIFIGVEIDGDVITLAAIRGLLDWQTEDKNLHVLFDQYYSEEHGKYLTGITRGITFETSFLIAVYNDPGSGASDDIEADLWYALI